MHLLWFCASLFYNLNIFCFYYKSPCWKLNVGTLRQKQINKICVLTYHRELTLQNWKAPIMMSKRKQAAIPSDSINWTVRRRGKEAARHFSSLSGHSFNWDPSGQWWGQRRQEATRPPSDVSGSSSVAPPLHLATDLKRGNQERTSSSPSSLLCTYIQASLITLS